MATVLDFFEWKRDRKRATLYPWDDWFNGHIWLLVNETDFKGKPRTMQNLILKSAKARGLRAKMELQPDGSIVLQAGPRMPPRKRGPYRKKGEQLTARETAILGGDPSL